MKVRLVGLGMPALLWACSAPKGPSVSVTVFIEKPNGADDSCLGVVGFDISSTGAGQTAQSGPILNAAAVQTLDGCRLDHPFTIDGLATDAPVTLTIHGYDGAGQARVSGTGTLDSLSAMPVPIVLTKEGTPPPPLILNRATLLGGNALSNVASMTIATAKGQPMKLLSVTPGPYFAVEPGGFGVEGVTNAEELTVEFTFLTPGINLPKQRVITTFDSTGPVFRAQ